VTTAFSFELAILWFIVAACPPKMIMHYQIVYPFSSGGMGKVLPVADSWLDQPRQE
jgi:hypothetical protein